MQYELNDVNTSIEVFVKITIIIDFVIMTCFLRLYVMLYLSTY